MVLYGALAATFLLFPAAGRGVLAAPRGPAVPLIFGAYPGGGAGTVGPAGRTAPEVPSKRLAALRELRAPGRPFVLHIYASFSGSASLSLADQVGRDIAEYTAAGFQVELVLTYRPADRDPARNVSAFREFSRDAVQTFGPNPRFVGLQVTNEANVRNAPNAADGAYPGAADALIEGVIAAKSEARRRGFSQVAIGFNWAYASGPAETAYWRRLGRSGGALFSRSIDWVGLDVYPGTWGPRTAGSDLKATTAKTMLASLGALRQQFMPLAGLPSSVPIHVSETGYPTGSRRTEAMQVNVMRASIAVVNANRSRYHVTDYRWFDLRDADSSNSSFESQYGLMRDDYTPKAGFAVYRGLVAALAP